MKQIKIVLAIFIALAMATPALAFNAEWHGDFNNRASYSTQGDMSTRVSKDSTSYYQVGTNSNIAVPAGVSTDKKSGDADFFAEVKYRTHLVVSDDENKVKGVIGLEIGSEKFGTDAAINGGDQTGHIELRWAYTDIELPFDAASRVSVGLQPVGYNAFLWSDNAAGVKWTRAEGAWKYSLGWWRSGWDQVGGSGTTGSNGGSDDSDNGDLYAADATYKFDTGAVNGFLIVRDQGEAQDLYLADGVTVGDTISRDDSYWLGLSGTNAWGDLSVMATGIYLGGTAKSDVEGDLDRKAYLFHAQGDYKMDQYTFTLGGLYASGDDDPTDDDLENFDHIDISTAILGSVIIFDNYADDNSFSQACYVFDQGYKIIYVGAKKAVNAKTTVWAKYFWHNTAEDELLGDDEIGHEFVVGTSYKIMKGLSADINAGYLIAGDAMDALATNGDADDIFRTDARLRFKF